MRVSGSFFFSHKHPTIAMPTPQEAETTELMENVTLEIGGGDPEALDDATKDKSFRKATAQLLVGETGGPKGPGQAP